MVKIRNFAPGTKVMKKNWKLGECKVTYGEVGPTALHRVPGFCSAVTGVEDMDAGRNSVSDGGQQNPNSQVASGAVVVYKPVADGKGVKTAEPN